MFIPKKKSIANLGFDPSPIHGWNHKIGWSPQKDWLGECGLRAYTSSFYTLLVDTLDWLVSTSSTSKRMKRMGVANLPRGGEEDANGIEGIGQPALKPPRMGKRFRLSPWFWRKWKAIARHPKAKEPRDKSLGWCSEKSGPKFNFKKSWDSILICVSVHDNLAQILVWLERCSPQTPRSPMPK